MNLVVGNSTVKRLASAVHEIVFGKMDFIPSLAEELPIHSACYYIILYCKTYYILRTEVAQIG
jgi:hypothetical protein